MASVAVAVNTLQLLEDKSKPLIVHVERLTTVVLARKAPSKYSLIDVPAVFEGQVPDTEVEEVEIVVEVIAGTVEVPVAYRQDAT